MLVVGKTTVEVLESDAECFPAMQQMVWEALDSCRHRVLTSKPGVITMTRVGRAGGRARPSIRPKRNAEPDGSLWEGRWQVDLVPAVFTASSPPPDVCFDREISVEEFILQNFLQVYTDTHIQGYLRQPREARPTPMCGVQLNQRKSLHGIEW